MRFALIGTGMMGIEHIQNVRLVPDAEIVALVDPVATSIAWSRNALGDKGVSVPAFDTVPAMLRAADIDAVIISSPNYTHAEVLDPLLDTPLHILCEKPLTTRFADARSVVDRANARPAGIFWTGMEYRFMPPVRRFIDEIHEGKVGRLKRLAVHEHRFPFLVKVGDWNRFNRNTGGTMVEKCCHFFDLMRHIVRAEPVRVFCSGAMDVNHLDETYEGQVPDIVDNSFTVVDFDNGVRVMLDLCMFAEGSEEQEQLVAIGDAAKLEVGIPSGNLTFSPRVGLWQPKQVMRQHVTVAADVLEAGHHHGATYYQLLAFLAAAAGQAPVQVTANDGLMAVAMGLAAERSITEKRTVELAEILAD
jgi:predicted dehydrogenase